MNLTTRRALGGFTLIELLVVIAIISILSSVVLASLNSARQKGRDARRVSDMKQIQLALELYYDNNSQYPTNGYSALTAALNGTYISTTPNDPTSGNAYGYYAAPSGCDNSGTKCTSYYVGAIMESTGQVGTLTNDDDTDLGGALISVNGSGLNCNENAGAANERLFCAGSL